MTGEFPAVVGAGSLRAAGGVAFTHRWTDEGVTVEADLTGGHLLSLSVAGCVLNDVYREAATLRLRVDGVRVTASGGFDTATWESTGITYRVEVDTPAAPEELARLLDVVDEVAEIPRALRAGAAVRRLP